MRLYPDSLLGRTLFALVGGLMIAVLLIGGFFAADRMRTLIDVGGRQVAERVGSIYLAMDRATPDARPQIARQFSSPAMVVRWTTAAPASDDEFDWRVWLVRRVVDEILPGVPEDAVRVEFLKARFRPGPGIGRPGDDADDIGESWDGDDVAGPGSASPALRGDMMMGRGRDAEGHHDAMWLAPHLRTMRRLWQASPVIGVSLRLSDGTWLALSAPLPRARALYASPLFAPMLAIGLIIIALSAWAVRRAVRPLGAFAKAAHRLGRDVRAPSLDESGPREVRDAARAFNRMQRRLRAFVEDRTQMLAAISHDLRTPITRLRLRAEFIEDPEQQRKVLADLAEMEAMIDASLSFARDDSRDEAKRSVDLAALVQTVCDDARDGGHDARFVGGPPVRVLAAPVGLKRALANLVENAAKYGKRAEVVLAVEGDDAVISVDDDGPGIPESEREAVFRPFHRVEGSRSRETGGVGLGLAVARSIARAHGGEVTLSNRPEGGLRARLSLPLGVAER